MADETVLICLLILPFAGCLVGAFIPSNRRNLEAWFAGTVASAGVILAWLSYPTIADGAVIRTTFEWLPSLGVKFTLRMDGRLGRVVPFPDTPPLFNSPYARRTIG